MIIMFDSEIIKEILKEILNYEDVDLDEIINNYEVIDGFYVFRYNNDAFFFINNTLIDSCPGYYAVEV